MTTIAWLSEKLGTYNRGNNQRKRKLRAEVDALKAESLELGGWKKRQRIQQETSRMLLKGLA